MELLSIELFSILLAIIVITMGGQQKAEQIGRSGFVYLSSFLIRYKSQSSLNSYPTSPPFPFLLHSNSCHPLNLNPDMVIFRTLCDIMELIMLMFAAVFNVFNIQ